MKLDTKAFAFTCGIIWELGLFGLTWWMIAFGGATGEKTINGEIYIGYSISAAGGSRAREHSFFPLSQYEETTLPRG